jgi:hypothetical protein
MSLSKRGIALSSLETWETLAGPKGSNQWVDGRSAKELARAWLEGDGKKLPVEVESLLANHKDFGPVRSWSAEPEAKLRFDTFAGEPRNSDLAVHAEDRHGSFLIAVEGKADEPFGETVSEARAAAVRRHLENSRSNGVARIEQLAAAMLAPEKMGDVPLGGIRYQLLTACAGALCEAERSKYTRALMLVHEFVTDKTSDDNHTRNAMDLNAFVSRLSHGSATAVSDGKIEGPFAVPGAPILRTKVALFIGKVRRNLRTGGV